MSQTICVYASSSDRLHEQYFTAAGDLGRQLAAAGHSLIYGGGKIGLMGAVARGVHAEGGQVISVIPEKLLPQGYDAADEIVVTQTMRERKAIMEERADAFVVLPGGLGTLEEMLEILTLKQLQYTAKPLVMVNTAGFFDPLITLFEHIYTEQFASPAFRVLYHLAADPTTALDYLAAYQPPELPVKWVATSKK